MYQSSSQDTACAGLQWRRHVCAAHDFVHAYYATWYMQHASCGSGSCPASLAQARTPYLYGRPHPCMFQLLSQSTPPVAVPFHRLSACPATTRSTLAQRHALPVTRPVGAKTHRPKLLPIILALALPTAALKPLRGIRRRRCSPPHWSRSPRRPWTAPQSFAGCGAATAAARGSRTGGTRCGSSPAPQAPDSRYP